MKTHTHHHLHSVRVILFGVLLIAVALVRVDAHNVPRLAENDASHVLAYSTSMSRNALLAENNASRAANGLGAFSLNSQLNNSAQAKAQNMADNNYWAHVAPDGTQPWYFFEAAGYTYSAAGENLAYGFDSSYSVNQGWMNSPAHRANILGDYVDVGYGFVNAPSFQGGEYTIVVAHYGKPLTVAVTTPTISQPTAAPQAPSPTPSSPSSAPASQPAAPNQSSPSTPDTSTPTTPVAQPATTPQASATNPQPSTQSNPPVAVAVGQAKSISVLESIRFGSIPLVAAVSLGVTLAVALGYGLTHRALMRHALATSEHFVVTHPAFDVMALVLAVALILSTTAARLQ